MGSGLQSDQSRGHMAWQNVSGFGDESVPGEEEKRRTDNGEAPIACLVAAKFHARSFNVSRSRESTIVQSIAQVPKTSRQGLKRVPERHSRLAPRQIHEMS